MGWFSVHYFVSITTGWLLCSRLGSWIIRQLSFCVFHWCIYETDFAVFVMCPGLVQNVGLHSWCLSWVSI